jgi:oligopeptide/dipeptide ABC transporter ATP-binding protein
MYSGRLVEVAPVEALRAGGAHPYTRGLLAATPRALGAGGGDPPASIPGDPPRLTDPPAGCRFHPRCPLAVDRCRVEAPALRAIAPAHRAACHLVEPSP